MKFITFTPSPALDLTFSVCGALHEGELNRAKGDMSFAAGGKGINVSRCLVKELGCADTQTFFYANRKKPFGKLLCSALKKEGIQFTALPYSDREADTRVCVKVSSDNDNKKTTEINGRGGTIREEDIERFISSVSDLVTSGEKTLLMLCGSIPQTVEIPVYNPVIKLMKSCGVICVLDSSGYSLREGISARPDLIKPNLSELSQLAGRRLRHGAEAVDFSKELFNSFGCDILLTNGGKAAYYVGKEGCFECTPKGDSNSLSTGCVGCGDAFLASYVSSRYGAGKSAEQSLNEATAFASDKAKRYIEDVLSRA